jgi:hypothetical protein
MITDNKKRLTLFINPAIAKHAKAQAVVEGITLTSLVERALIKYLPKETVLRKEEIRVDFDS